MTRPTLALLVFMSALLAACATGEQLAPRSTSYRPNSPRSTSLALRTAAPDTGSEAYARVGRSALGSAVPVPPGFAERLALPAGEAHAVAYELRLAQGQRIEITVAAAPGAAPYRVDLFERVPPDSFRHVAALANGGTRAEFVSPAAGSYVLRLAPAGAGPGEYTLRVSGESWLSFPVPGYGADAIRSPYGSTRDGGARSHEGVDIFAPRGTPVVAAASAVVTRVERTGTGGKVIWAHDPALDLTYFYAHLDAQLVEPGQRISPGDTIGRVGNTGNARGASPHLHFSIYGEGYEAIDPTPLLQGAAIEFDGAAERARLLGRWAQTRGSRVRLRAVPSTAGPVIAELDRATPVRVLGAMREWRRVQLADGRTGFIAARLLEGASLATY